MLRQALDLIDEAAATLIRFTYLLSGITAVAVYFGAGVLPGFIEGPLNFLLPWLLAFSVETQSYLSARNISKAWRTLQSPVLDKHQRKQAMTDLLVNIGVLIPLMSFSVWNQLNYLLATWTPTDDLGLPPIVAYLVRACAAPTFFILAAFLAPQAETIGERMNKEAHSTLVQFLKVLKKQRGKAIKRLKKQPVDMSKAIEAVGTAANEKKAATMVALVQQAIVNLSNGASPQVAARQAETQAGVQAAPTQKLARKGTPQDRCRRAYRKGMSWQQLKLAAQVSDSTAKRYVKQFEEETISA